MNKILKKHMQEKKDQCGWKEYSSGRWESGCNGGDMGDDLHNFVGPKAYAWEFCPWCGAEIIEEED